MVCLLVIQCLFLLLGQFIYYHGITWGPRISLVSMHLPWESFCLLHWLEWSWVVGSCLVIIPLAKWWLVSLQVVYLLLHVTLFICGYNHSYCLFTFGFIGLFWSMALHDSWMWYVLDNSPPLTSGSSSEWTQRAPVNAMRWAAGIGWLGWRGMALVNAMQGNALAITMQLAILGRFLCNRHPSDIQVTFQRYKAICDLHCWFIDTVITSVITTD